MDQPSTFQIEGYLDILEDKDSIDNGHLDYPTEVLCRKCSGRGVIIRYKTDHSLLGSIPRWHYRTNDRCDKCGGVGILPIPISEIS